MLMACVAVNLALKTVTATFPDRNHLFDCHSRIHFVLMEFLKNGINKFERQKGGDWSFEGDIPIGSG